MDRHVIVDAYSRSHAPAGDEGDRRSREGRPAHDEVADPAHDEVAER
jgi:hypothetical protein